MKSTTLKAWFIYSALYINHAFRVVLFSFSLSNYALIERGAKTIKKFHSANFKHCPIRLLERQRLVNKVGWVVLILMKTDRKCIDEEANII